MLPAKACRSGNVAPPANGNNSAILGVTARWSRAPGPARHLFKENTASHSLPLQGRHTPLHAGRYPAATTTHTSRMHRGQPADRRRQSQPQRQPEKFFKKGLKLPKRPSITRTSELCLSMTRSTWQECSQCSPRQAGVFSAPPADQHERMFLLFCVCDLLRSCNNPPALPARTPFRQRQLCKRLEASRPDASKSEE